MSSNSKLKTHALAGCCRAPHRERTRGHIPKLEQAGTTSNPACPLKLLCGILGVRAIAQRPIVMTYNIVHVVYVPIPYRLHDRKCRSSYLQLYISIIHMHRLCTWDEKKLMG